MRQLAVGDRAYRLVASADGGNWVCRAERADTGERFGIACAGATEAEAIGRLERWLTWQETHRAALLELQACERAYHRAVSQAAFRSPRNEPDRLDAGKVALDQVEAARRRLDEIRARRPGE